ncbi:MAG: hypothetical protein PF569_09320 [Candidatus Woesearchaeota archaeon]|jgi:hypothetical protein|nr:hypothetical protein [Candidatus Woesearchaeota archaeon]
MNNEKGSIEPFKPVELLLNKVVARFFSAKNRERNLDGYSRLYLSFKSFYKTVMDLNREIEKGITNNDILDQPRKTHFMRDIETKIEAIPSEQALNNDDTDLDTCDLVVFDISKMEVEDFKFVNSLKK